MKTHKILIVDDSPTAVKTTAQTLESAGHEVFLARDGQQAIEAVLAHQPDLIVLDIILPKKNGYQVCRQIKSNPTTSHIKILLLSSKSQDRDIFWGEKQGADCYITKPYENAVLISAVQRLTSPTPTNEWKAAGSA